jgi:DNA-binding response OmpR family regulator
MAKTSRIVIVDDDTTILKYCAMTLRPLGHQVMIFPETYGALVFLQLQPVDLLIVDLVMPDLDGFEFLKTLKKIETFRGSILMLTGNRSSEDVKKALSLGVKEYLVKPFDKDVFTKKIESILPPKKELQNKPTVKMARTIMASLNRSLAIHLLSINENGIMVRSNQFLPLLGQITLDTELFEQIGIAQPFFKVSDGAMIDPASENPFETFLEFDQIDPDSLSKIKAWIARKQ